jgi:hypothetical protein
LLQHRLFVWHFHKKQNTMSIGLDEFILKHEIIGRPVGGDGKGWIIMYAGVQCLAQVAHLPTEELLAIKPLRQSDAIGEKAGETVFKSFPKIKPLEQTFSEIYNQGIDHAIKVVDDYNSGTDYSKLAMKQKIISELQKLKQ